MSQTIAQPTTSPRAAVMGWPVDHSLSPRLHNTWLKLYGLDGVYEKIAVPPEQLASQLQNIKAKGYRGVNLTVPLKELALKVVDEIDPLAKRVGAINTVVVRGDGSLLGRNTDVFGFAENLRSNGFHFTNKTVTLLGAGGAARAALVALLDMGAQDIRLVNRTRDKAQALAEEFGADKIHMFVWGDAGALYDSDLLINATSLGLKGLSKLEIDLSPLPYHATVTDMVYMPLMTDLLIAAQERSLKTIDGLGMLLHQARPAFEAFFGHDPEVTEELRREVMLG